MNEFTVPQDPSDSTAKSTFLPLVLVALSFVLVLIFQVSMQMPQRNLLQNIIKQNERNVEQSVQLQSRLQKLVMDIMEASKNDKDAQSIIAKYGIQMTGASAAPAAK